MNDKVVKLLATFFGVGYFPVAPGTVASAVGAGIWFLTQGQVSGQILLIIVITVLGLLSGGLMEKITGKKDPGCVVIDEVVGMMIGLLFLPCQWPVVVTAFFLFRAFDMFKIYPANKFESYAGSFGIMADDVVAGIYTNVVMQIAVRWSGIAY